MYIIKTYLAQSLIHGIGVFAGEDVPKGALVWQLVEGFDRVFGAAEVEKMPARAREYLRRYAFLQNGKFYLCGDYGQFINHSETPNVIDAPDGMSEIAARDISKGEELTSDYRAFDDISRADMGFEVNTGQSDKRLYK